MVDLNKDFQKKINKVFCDYAKCDINKEKALNNLSTVSLEIKNNPFIKKRVLKNQVFQIKRFINK